MSHPGGEKIVNGSAKCDICLNIMIKPVTFPCKHEVCHACYSATMEMTNLNCPFCRKRLSVWSRRNVNNLINESRWQEICSLYPDQVRRALAETAASAAGEQRTEQTDLDFESEYDQIVRVVSAPGEVKRELEYFAAQEAAMRQKEREREEEQSLSFIQSHFREETEAMARIREQEEQDAALARALQQELDEESERQKEETNNTGIRTTRRRTTRTSTRTTTGTVTSPGSDDKQSLASLSPEYGRRSGERDGSQESGRKRRRPTDQQTNDDSKSLCNETQTVENVTDVNNLIVVLNDHSYAMNMWQVMKIVRYPEKK